MTTIEQPRVPRVARFVAWFMIIRAATHGLSLMLSKTIDLVVRHSPEYKPLSGLYGLTYHLDWSRTVLFWIDLTLAFAFIVLGIALLRHARYARIGAVWALLLAIGFQLMNHVMPALLSHEIFPWLWLLHQVVSGLLYLMVLMAGNAVLLLALETPSVRRAWDEEGAQNAVSRLADRLCERIPAGLSPLIAVISVLLLLTAAEELMQGIGLMRTLRDTLKIILPLLQVNIAYAVLATIGFAIAGTLLWLRTARAHQVAIWIIFILVVCYLGVVLFAVKQGLFHTTYSYPGSLVFSLLGFLFSALSAILPLILMILFLRRPEDRAEADLAEVAV